MCCFVSDVPSVFSVHHPPAPSSILYRLQSPEVRAWYAGPGNGCEARGCCGENNLPHQPCGRRNSPCTNSTQGTVRSLGPSLATTLLELCLSLTCALVTVGAGLLVRMVPVPASPCTTSSKKAIPTRCAVPSSRQTWCKKHSTGFLERRSCYAREAG